MNHYYVSTTGNDGGGGHDGSTEALAWLTLQYAVDTVANAGAVISDTTVIWVKAGTYTLGSTIGITNRGNIDANRMFFIIGYNTTNTEATLQSDMDYGQTYHETALAAYISGTPDSNKWVDIDGDGLADELIDVPTEAITFRHCWIHNTNKASGSDSIGADGAAPFGVTFDHCAFTDAYKLTSLNGFYMWLFKDCMIALDTNVTTPIAKTSKPGLLFVGCVIDLKVLSYGPGVDAAYGFFLMYGNLVIGGTFGVQSAAYSVAFNNIFYNQGQFPTGGAAYFGSGTSAIAHWWNNIFMPTKKATDSGYLIASGKGMLGYHDFNNYWALDGDLGGRWETIQDDAAVMGNDSIAADPAFVDAASDDYRSKNVDLLDGASPDVHGNKGEIGALTKIKWPTLGDALVPGTPSLGE